MTAWLETCKALLLGAFKRPKDTTVVVKNTRTGKITARKAKSTPRDRTRGN